jgi:hypothetical protein
MKEQNEAYQDLATFHITVLALQYALFSPLPFIEAHNHERMGAQT